MSTEAAIVSESTSYTITASSPITRVILSPKINQMFILVLVNSFGYNMPTGDIVKWIGIALEELSALTDSMVLEVTHSLACSKSG